MLDVRTMSLYLVMASKRAENARSVPLDERLIVPCVYMHVVEFHVLQLL